MASYFIQTYSTNRKLLSHTNMRSCVHTDRQTNSHSHVWKRSALRSELDNYLPNVLPKQNNPLPAYKLFLPSSPYFFLFSSVYECMDGMGLLVVFLYPRSSFLIAFLRNGFLLKAIFYPDKNNFYNINLCHFIKLSHVFDILS